MYPYPQYQNHEPHSYTYAPEDYFYHPRDNDFYLRSRKNDLHLSPRDYGYHYPPRENDYPFLYVENSPPLRNRMKQHRRSRSISKSEQYNHYNNHNPTDEKSDYYYHGPHRLDGVRSVSPLTENRHYPHNSINRVLPTEVANNSRRAHSACFVNLNQPMIHPMTSNYCMPQSLGTCPHNNDFFFVPPQQQNVPMMQPYFMNQPNNSNTFVPSTLYQPLFPPFMPMPALHPDILSQAAAATITSVSPTAEEVVPSPNSKPTSPATETQEIELGTTEVVPEQQVPPQPPVVLHRRRSIMEEILSSFSLLGDGVNYAPAVNPSKPDIQRDDTATSPQALAREKPLYTSLSDALNYGSRNRDKKQGSLSRKTSLKLYKKANALQNRHYIWCYRPFEPKQDEAAEVSNKEASSSNSLWAAFDMNNQTKLDYHYSLIATKKSNDDNAQKPKITANNLPDMITDDPSLILMLQQQSAIPNPVMIAFGDGKAWYNTLQGEDEHECHLLEITCLPSHDHRLVVSNDLLNQGEPKSLRRSKSMDGLASKLLNTVFGW